MTRFLFRVLAVLGISIGVGMLTWGIMAANLGEPVRSPKDYFELGLMIQQPSEAIGWGAGFFAGGLTAFVLSFCCGRKKKSKFEE